MRKRKHKRLNSLNKLYYESQYQITRVCGKDEHHDQMEVNAECVTNPSRVAEFLTGNKFPEDMLNLKLQHASYRVRIKIQITVSALW
jgi:hypothetical protein